jgi:hypothetical protein
MKLWGWCSKCRRIRNVRVDGNMVVRSMALNGMPIGVCDECEEDT